jgi:hypothetical protein
LEKYLVSVFETSALWAILPPVLRDEIRFELSQFDDWHLREMIGEKDPDIMRVLGNQVREADWVEQARDSSEGEVIARMVQSEIARRGG